MQTYLSTIDSALRRGDVRNAARISDEAVRNGIEHPVLLALAAHHNLNLNRNDRALALAERARILEPDNVDVLNAFGCCLLRHDRTREALTAFDAALNRAPGSAITHYNKATALEQVGELKHAREHYLRVVSLASNHLESLIRLAHLASKRGDTKEARKFGERALQFDSKQIHAQLALAAADIADGKFKLALATLQSALHEPHRDRETRAAILSMMGDALDGLGDTENAFDAYTKSGEEYRTVNAPIFEGQSALDLVSRLTSYFSDAAPSWQIASKGCFSPPVKTHVFLVGFPRSGTTLLGQVLAAHPKIESMEERACLIDAHRFVLEEGGLDRLSTMDGAELDVFRAAYWKRVAEEWSTPVKPVFVDKLPLNSVLLCLVAKLFPEAKILLALRDPRDVVFSCFRRRFGMTQQMFELLTLEGAATYYDAVMKLIDAYRTTLRLTIYEARYETLVSDFAGEADRLCSFLGIEFDADVETFASKAQARHIDTPSAAQVAQGLYSQGIGQWQFYRDHLASIMPILSPWIACHGYEFGSAPVPKI